MNLICENCEQLHNGSYGTGRFCNQKCARGFATKNKRSEINKKVSDSLRQKFGSLNISSKIVYCLYCNKEMIISESSTKKFCSRHCTGKYNYQFIKYKCSEGGKKSAQSQKRRSKNEIYFSELCSQQFNNISLNECFFDGWDADIILHDYKIAILWNGIWHYVDGITKSHSLKQVQTRDKIKIDKIIEMGYKPFIIKDMGKYNKKFVETQYNIFLEYINSLSL